MDYREKLALLMAKTFVTEQSQGEWSDEAIDEDAAKLVKVMLEFTDLIIKGAMA